MSNFLNLQIIRIDGLNCFVEVMSGGFAIGKVNLNFIKYDENKEKGSKQIAKINAYMNIDEFLLLAQDVLSGKIHALAEAEKASGKKYPGVIWAVMGGQSAKRAKREDGKALSRQIKIIPGLKKPFLLKAEQGIGEENATGLIVPKYGNNPEAQVQIPLTADDLKKIVLIVKTHIEAFYSAVYSGAIKLPNTYEGNNGENHLPA